MTSVWSLAAAIAVHLTLAVALILVLYTYHYLRERRDFVAVDAGVVAWSLIAAHFAAVVRAPAPGASRSPRPRSPTWRSATRSPRPCPSCAHRRVVIGRAADIGLDAALLTIGALTGALLGGAIIVVVLAIPVVITLHNAALTQQLEDDASIDKKTGLANTAHLAGQRRPRLRRRDAGPRSVVLMVDLDHFKRLNDTYGHRAGDDVLTAVGACLRSQLRRSDLAGRFGGEEFTVLLPDTNLIDTVTTAERIRVAIEELRVSTVDNNGTAVVIADVTASIGAATHPHHGTTAQECLRVADNRVYQAKQQGRNRVVGNNTENLTSYPAKFRSED